MPGYPEAEGREDRQGDVGEHAREDAMRRAQEECGRECPGERGEEAYAQRGGESAARNPCDDGRERARGHEQEGRERAGGGAERRDGGTQEGKQNRQGIRATGIAVSAGDPRGPRGVPQLRPGRRQRHPRSAHEACRGSPPLRASNQRRHDREAEAGGGRAKSVAPHRSDNERINALAVLILIHARRFLAQRGGGRLEAAQGRTGDGTRLSRAGTPGEQTRGRSNHGEKGTDFGQGQGGASRQDPPQGARRTPHEEPQSQEGQDEGGHGLAPVVHLGVAALTERSVGRSVPVDNRVGHVARRLIAIRLRSRA